MATFNPQVVQHVAGVLRVLLERVLRFPVRSRRTLAEAANIDSHDAETLGKPPDEVIPKLFKLEEKDLVPQIDDVLTIMDFYDKSAGSQIIFI